MIRIFTAFLFLILQVSAFADDFRPGSLSIKALDNNLYSVTLKVPIKKQRFPKFKIVFDEQTNTILPKRTVNVGGALVQSWNISRPNNLSEFAFVVEGLIGSNYELIVRITDKSGAVASAILNTENNAFEMPKEIDNSKTAVFVNYLLLGFEHILIGLDHLLFVFALMLIVVGVKKLVWTITFFTIAHSITLIMVTLNWFTLPSLPVEAVIALSIVFLARELVLSHKGHVSITKQYPWVVAFIFGLLHGMGFAGALGEIGIPENEVLLALLSFNVGVELGQLAFIVVMLVLISLVKYIFKSFPLIPKTTPAYFIGCVASYWLIERVVAF